MAKDRLIELHKAVHINGSQCSEENEVANKKSSTETRTKDLRKTYEQSEVLKQCIEEIENNVEEIRQLLKRVEDIKTNQKDVRSRLDSLFQQNTSLSHQVTGKLREFQAEAKEATNASAAGRIVTIQFNSVKTRFQEAFRSHTAQLDAYKRMQKDQIRAHLMAKGDVRISEQELDSLIEGGGNIQVFTENIIAETTEARRMLADIEERHEQLLKIEQMIREVRDLFLQMAFLVDTQQELVDRVEFQARQAAEFIGSGVVDLEKAKTNKKRYRRRKIYSGVGVIIVIILIVLIYFIPKN